MRWIRVLFTLLLLGFGYGCLNYTVHGKAEFHREWAREKGLPEPSHGIFYAGLACLALGGVLAGWQLGHRPADS